MVKKDNKRKIKISFFELEGWEKELILNSLSAFKTDLEIKFSKNTAIPDNSDIISIFIYSKIDKKFIERAKNLKLIITRSAGVDHIDMKYAKTKGIIVKNCPAYGPSSIAEYSFLLMLSLMRKLKQTLLAAYDWNIKDFDLRGHELRNKTIGIIGTGKIGSVACKIARGFEMKVLAYDIKQNSELIKSGVKYTEFEEILKKADVIAFYLPLTESTYHILNKSNISMIKKKPIIVNVSRGPIIETEALLIALKQNIISGIALDVFEGEKTLKICEMIGSEKTRTMKKEELIKFSEIYELLNKYKDRVILTPHIAYNTWESINNIWEESLRNVKEYIKKAYKI